MNNSVFFLQLNLTSWNQVHYESKKIHFQKNVFFYTKQHYRSDVNRKVISFNYVLFLNCGVEFIQQSWLFDSYRGGVQPSGSESKSDSVRDSISHRFSFTLFFFWYGCTWISVWVTLESAGNFRVQIAVTWSVLIRSRARVFEERLRCCVRSSSYLAHLTKREN